MSKEMIDRIRKAIGTRSVNSVAKECGIPQSSMRSFMERGSDPSYERLAEIARVTNVHLHWLATGEGPMRPGDPIKVPGIVTPDGTIKKLTEARAFVEQVLQDDLRGIGEKARELTDEEVLALAASIHKTRETLG